VLATFSKLELALVEGAFPCYGVCDRLHNSIGSALRYRENEKLPAYTALDTELDSSICFRVLRHPVLYDQLYAAGTLRTEDE